MDSKTEASIGWPAKWMTRSTGFNSICPSFYEPSLRRSGLAGQAEFENEIAFDAGKALAVEFRDSKAPLRGGSLGSAPQDFVPSGPTNLIDLSL